MLIGGLNKFSIIDYPQKISTVVFTQGCNFRCPYCHNPELLKTEAPNSNLSDQDILSFLKSRKGKIDAVVITGGEPTLQEDLLPFIKKIKELELLVKLDTNGSNPEVLNQIIAENLCDYIAMDYKAPLENYSKLVGTTVKKADILLSKELILKCNLDYEFRTTISKSLLSENDIIIIFKELKNAKRIVLQKVIPGKTLNNKIMFEFNYSNNEFIQFKNLALKYIQECTIR